MIAPPGIDPIEYAQMYQRQRELGGVDESLIDAALWATYGYDFNYYSALKPEQQQLFMLINSERANERENKDAILAAYADSAAGQQRASDLAAATDAYRMQQADQLTDAAYGADLALYDQLNQATSRADAADAGTVGALTGMYGDAANAETVALTGLQDARQNAATNTMGTLGYMGGLTDEANQRDLYSLARAEQTYGRALRQGEDIGAELDALNAGLGSGDVQWGIGTQRVPQYDAAGNITGYRYERPEYEGFDAITSRAAQAAADPEAVEAQRRALQQTYALTSGDLTAQERLNMETARRAEERDRRAYTQAKLRDLSERGMGGSGAEVTAMLGGQQLTAENRMLQDMAAAAAASQRAERMVGQYGDLAGQMRQQSFGEQYQTGTAADSIAQFNAEQAKQEQQWISEQNRTLDQDAWQRQLALADDARAQQDRMIEGTQYMLGAYRDTTADAYGRGADLGDRYLSEYDQQYDRGLDAYEAQRAAADANWSRGYDLGQTQLGVTDTAYNRDLGLAGAGSQLVDTNYQRQGDYLDSLRQATADYYLREQDRQANTMNAASLYTDQGNASQAGESNAYQQQVGQLNAEAAQKALDEDNDGLLGIGFLGL